MKKYIPLLLLSLFTSTSQAEEIDPKYFKDWFTLTDLLKTKNIAPNGPNWAVIIPMCVGLKDSSDETPYNRCLYEKVLDEVQWQADNKYCKEKADSEYDSYQQTERKLNSIVVVGADGKRTVVEQDTRGFNDKSPSYKDRNIFYKDCMILGMKWNNVDNWATGRRD